MPEDKCQAMEAILEGQVLLWAVSRGIIHNRGSVKPGGLEREADLC